ncbi:MAG: acetyl-coenzyme A synthetase N-terminal domain-containing protein, partial [Phycisphaerales bacterium]
MTSSNDNSIESIMHELREFAPPKAEEVGAERWLVSSMEQYRSMYAQSIEDPHGFYAEHAADLKWFEKWSRVVEFEAPDAKWFVDGKTNLCYNCIDRHVDEGHGGKTAIIWEGEPVGGAWGDGPEILHLTYAQMQEQVARFANLLKASGVRKGDVVTIYMGMVPELAVAVLACARLGAVHS